MRILGTPADVLQVSVSTWANRGSGQAVGDLKRITDIGPVPGTLMWWDGTYWKIAGPSAVLFDTTLVTGAANTNEQLLKQFTVPAGLLRACRYFSIKALLSRNGTTDALTAQLRMGSAGTTSDTSLNSSSVTSTSRSVAMEFVGFMASTTQLRIMGTQGGLSGWPGTAVSTAYPNNKTIADIDASANIISASTTMAGTTNLSEVSHMLVELWP